MNMRALEQTQSWHHSQSIDLETLRRSVCNVLTAFQELNEIANGQRGISSKEIIARARDTLLPMIPGLRNQIANAAQIASPADITKALTVLIACYSSAERKDLSVFGRLAVSDIASVRPTVMQLDEAFTKIRRTCKWIPTIAEILEAIAAAPTYCSMLQYINTFEERIAAAEFPSTKRALPPPFSRPLDRRRELDRCRARVRDHASCAGYDSEIIAEARRLENIPEDNA